MSEQVRGKTRNGVGSYKTKAGETRYRVTIKVHGKTVSKAGFVNKGEAERWRDLRRADVVKGDWIDPQGGRITFGEFAEEWLDTVDGLRDSTRASYRHQLDHQLAYWATTPLASISLTDVRRWAAEMRGTNGTITGRPPSDAWVKKSLRLFKRICAEAVNERKIQRSPCEHFEIKPDESPESYCPTYEDVLTMAGTVPDQYRALVLLAGLGGLRWGECVALERHHVNVSGGYVEVRQIVVETVDHDVYVQDQAKTKAGKRTVDLHPLVVDALTHHLVTYAEPGNDGLLFTASRSGNADRPYLRRSNFYSRVWRPAFKECGIERFRFHDLRHAAATMAAQTGATTRELMDHLGHSTPGASMRYQHASRERMQTMRDRMAEMFPAPTPAATGTDNVIPLR